MNKGVKERFLSESTSCTQNTVILYA